MMIGRGRIILSLFRARATQRITEDRIASSATFALNSAECRFPFIGSVLHRPSQAVPTGREGCIHVSGLLSQPLAAGLDEFRGSTPKSPHRARWRLVPVGLADPRPCRFVITSHHPCPHPAELSKPGEMNAFYAALGAA